MKTILMSIKPKWVEKIANGEKTVEVRKSVPKCGTPFKVYMYCTNDRKETLCVAQGGLAKKGDLYLNGNIHYPYTCGTLNGKVVGEFVCDEVFEVFSYGIIRRTCLSEKELDDYLKNSDGYGLHISDLKIYDKPKELSEFRKPCDRFVDCLTCERGKIADLSCSGQITRPPQSWQFVEEV